MWIDRSEYGRLVGEAAKVAGLERQAAANGASVEWMRVRVNQLETERAALFVRVAGVPINVPSLQPRGERSPLHATADVSHVPDLSEYTSLFDDLGDDAAHKAGIRNAPDGSLIHDRES